MPKSEDLLRCDIAGFYEDKGRAYSPAFVWAFFIRQMDALLRARKERYL